MPMCVFIAELVLPHSEDVRSVQTRLVWDQRGLVCLPVLPTEQVSHLYRFFPFFLFQICCTQYILWPSDDTSKGHWLIQILSSGHRTCLVKTIPTKGVQILFPTSSIGRTGFWAFTEKDYIRVLITTFQMTQNWYFPHSPLLLESQKKTLGGKCDTIGNSLNFAITYGDAVLQSAQEGIEKTWLLFF